MSHGHLRILSDEVYGAIGPRLYGHFAEHLGRCCYDGLWIGNHPGNVDHIDGFRKDVVEALREMPTPMLRWPGGCYADHYHWRDGIGPAASRPKRLGLSCGLQVEDDNSLGTHEFLRLCELIGAEAYLAGNMGSGSVQEMCDWLEYCNASVSTDLSKERAKNGHPAPFGVKLWGVGNENWGCGGEYEPDDYAREFKRYAGMLKHVDPTAEFVACGFDASWNRILMDKLRNHLQLIDHLSVHRYWINGGPGAAFTEQDYYTLLEEASQTEAFILETKEILDEVVQGRRKVGIALDEWGVWHPEARSWGPGAVSTTLGGDAGDYTQAGTQRDAVAIAVALEGFHRQCASLSLANLAQIVNVLHAPVMTEGEHFWVTPSYHALRLHRDHIGGTAVRTEIEGGSSLPGGHPALSSTASVKDGNVTVTMVNRHMTEGATLRFAGQLENGRILSSARPQDGNDSANPDRVTLREVSASGDAVELPPHSIATFTLK